jgi:hypothetical protein
VCSLSLAPLCQPRLLAGQEHGRTIPLADMVADCAMMHGTVPVKHVLC